MRAFDCACDYGNEVEVGEGIQRALKEGIVKREDLFITSKLWNTYHAKEHVELAARKSLTDLQLDYFDLYLVHFPISMKFVPFEVRYPPEWIYDPTAGNPRIEQVYIPVQETWTAMEQLVDKNLSRAIGLCNFNVQGLTDILSYATRRPVVLQIELHPYLQQQQLVDFCTRNNIQVTGFSPLGSSSYIELDMDQQCGIGVLNEVCIFIQHCCVRRHNENARTRNSYNYRLLTDPK
jgi:diketogulonate reductase-like aldo/keto reductase